MLGALVAMTTGAQAQHQASRETRPSEGPTEREVEVLGLMARGLTNKQIATELGIANKTAGNHVQNVLRKIGVSTRAAAAMFAMEAGLVA